MTILNLVQGTEAWHAHRAQHFNASDAAAMLGISPYKTRAQLLEERATGITPEVSEFQQGIFDSGHAAEAYARPLAEKLLDEELYPCTVTDGRLSASLDGMTLDGSVIFECKLMNETLRQIMEGPIPDRPGSELLEYHRVQMEQQLLLSGAEKCLFTASEGREDGDTFHRWYLPDPALRVRILAGWKQFEADLAGWSEPHEPTQEFIGKGGAAPESLPALNIQLTGTVLACNLGQWKTAAMACLRSINTDLQTDDDFADADSTVKWCETVEARIASAKEHALSQTDSIEALFRDLDAVSEETRRIRLRLSRQIESEKTSRRAEIVQRAADSVRAHYAKLNEGLGEYAIHPPQSMQMQIGSAIKGRKTLATITDAANTAAAEAKIEGTQRAERIQACMAVIEQHQEHISLLPDRVSLANSKTPEDLQNLITARVAEHERLQSAAARQLRATESAGVAQPVEQLASNQSVAGSTPAVRSNSVSRMVKLGDLNAAIAPLSITGTGLADLGFEQAGQEKNAKLYDAGQWPVVRAKLIEVLNGAEI